MARRTGEAISSATVGQLVSRLCVCVCVCVYVGGLGGGGVCGKTAMFVCRSFFSYLVGFVFGVWPLVVRGCNGLVERTGPDVAWVYFINQWGY